MGKSDTALLRKELAKILRESKIYQKKTDKIINELTNKLAQRDAEIDLLRLALADRDRRIAFYENPNAPSSTGSMYSTERAAFRKQMSKEEGEEEEDESGGGPESDDPQRKGPPKGHTGTPQGGNQKDEKYWNKHQ